ncbi:VTT domain-containing protein [Myxococcota bacterium]|nr:VTT domain-containing protein [Myxococcota bacterium]MBU1379887.1 VTT domain-containing protein [Myxococcota bacterium]MBU1498772.1 VTT domain-containing protein [Myxococcota bacterium]
MEKAVTEGQEKPKGGKLKKLIRKIILWALILGSFYVLFLIFKQDLINLLKKSETAWAMYVHISGQISGKTLLGLAYAGFFGSLFFILIPLEAVFFYYLSLPHHPWLVLVIMLFTSVIGLCADYLMGRLVGEGVMLKLSGPKFVKYRDAMTRWGGMIIVISNIIPFLPVQIISLAVGATRYGLKRFFVYTMIGRTAYLIALLYGADLFKKYLGALL